MRIHFVLIAIITLIINLDAQQMKFGLTAGTNLCFVQTSSELNMQNKPEYIPGLGFELGISSSIDISENAILISGFLFQSLRTKGGNKIQFGDLYGIYSNDNYRERKNTFNQFLIEMNLAYKITPYLLIGAGGNAAIKISANTKYVLNGNSLKVSNTYLDPVRFYVPLFLGFNSDRYKILFGYRQGIGNRLIDNASRIKENEGHIFVSAKYFFSKSE